MIQKIKEYSGVIALLAIIFTWIVPSPTNFGASGTRFPNGLSADSTSPIAGEVRGTTLTVTGAATIGSTLGLTGVATFDGGITMSSSFATSSEGAATYTAANITGKNTILHNATGALTATLPATSTLTSFVPNTGDRVSIVLVNIGAGALTLAGGTGMNVYNASSTLVMEATSAALLEFVRQADTDIAVFFSPGR